MVHAGVIFLCAGLTVCGLAVLYLVSRAGAAGEQPEPVIEPPRTDCHLEVRFRNAFSMMPQERREAILMDYQTRNGCDRQGAIQMALDDLLKDIQRHG